MNSIFRFVAKTLSVLILFTCFPLFSSVPPHARVQKLIQEKKIPQPYYLKNRARLLKAGVNAPWKTKTLKQKSVAASGSLTRSLGPSLAPTGAWKALLLVVKFSDKPQNVPAGFFDSLIFGQMTGTMRDYYKKVSYNNLDIVTVNLPSTVGWMTMPHTYAYYVNGQNGFGSYPQNAQKLVEDALAAADSSVDYSQYDNDGDGYVDALFVVHSGPGAEFTGSNYDIWSHAWVTSTVQVRDGVNIYHYSMEPEYWDMPGDMTCGVYAHELGHAGFGLPDLYDVDYSSRGLGHWSLMAGGSWNGAMGLGESPAFPDAWSHFQMGYVTPTNISTNTLNQSVNNIENTAEAYRLWTDGTAGNQYFLMENRQQTGYDTYLPGNGLLIYHIDEAVTSDNQNEWYPGHTTSGHFLVALEQADGLYELEKSNNSGNTGDPFPGSTNARTFGDLTAPSSRDYANAETKVEVNNISNSGSVMTANMQIGLVAGKPAIVVNPENMEFGSILIGDLKTDTLLVANIGGEPLVVSSISSNLAAFVSNNTNFTVQPGQTQPVLITFTPTNAIAYNGTLSISSNDTARSVVNVAMVGNGQYAPSITVVPDSLTAELAEGDSTTRILTIGNTGAGNLEWNIVGFSPPARIMKTVAALRTIPPVVTSRSPSISNGKNVSVTPSVRALVDVYSSSLSSSNANIAVLGADGSNGYVLLNDVSTILASSGLFSTVTTINGRSLIPNVDQLLAFDAVVVFGWYGWADPIAIGNVLADYVDQGGNVLIAFAANGLGGGWNIGGRFSSGNYWLIQPNSYSGSTPYSIGTVFHPEHPIMHGINTVVSYSKLHSSTTISPSATRIADFTDGTPLVVVSQSTGGRRVDFSFPIMSTTVDFWGIDKASDADELFINAVQWLAGSARWLTVSPNAGTVIPGASTNVEVSFNAKNLNGGEYRTVIPVSSNDPVLNPKNIPAAMNVIGTPEIVVSPTTMNSGTVFIGTQKNDTIRVQNSGSESLVVTDITSDNAAFAPDNTPFTLLPGESRNVLITFSPTEVMPYSGTLFISSNDTVRGTVSVQLTGQGAITPPVNVNALDHIANKVILYWSLPYSSPIQRSGYLGNDEPGRIQITANTQPILPKRSFASLYYKIYRSTVSGGPYALLDSTAALQYEDVTVSNGTQYYYVITSANGSFESGFSTEEIGYPVNESGTGARISHLFSPSSAQFPYGLAVNGNDLWVTEYYDNKVYQLDKNTGSVLSSFFTPSIQPTGITWDGSSLWITNTYNDNVYKVDTQGNILQSFSVPPDTVSAYLTGIAYENGHIWVVDRDNNRLLKYDAATGTMLATVKEPFEVTFYMPTAPRGLTYDPSTNSLLHVITDFSQPAVQTYIYEFDLTTERFTGRRFGFNRNYDLELNMFYSNGRGITYDSGNNSYWVSDVAYGVIYQVLPFTTFTPFSEVTFHVNTKNNFPSVKPLDHVGIRGSIGPLDWYRSVSMNDADNDSIYDITIPFDGRFANATLEYKFVV
ncbi:MAG: M6 family metalloprotease domain-containing protein, partial [Bacteroidota bacterium]